MRTQDGGTSWQTIQPQGSSQRLWGVEYSGPDTVFLAGDSGVISRSLDGGATFNSIQSGGTAVTHDIDALDARRAWSAQDGGEITYTIDGGRQWVRTTVQGFDLLGKIFAVAFADTARGWAAGANPFFGGSNGILSRSSDGGKTWQQQLTITDFTFNGLETINTLTAFAVGGYDFVGGGLVLRTVDGGVSWQDVAPISAGFRDVFLPRRQHRLDRGREPLQDDQRRQQLDETIRRQRDGVHRRLLLPMRRMAGPSGSTISSCTRPMEDKPGSRKTSARRRVTAINGVTAINSTTAWIAGWAGFVARTTNSGQTWRPETIAGAETVDFEDALFLDANRGWVGGNIGIWQRR